MRPSFSNYRSSNGAFSKPVSAGYLLKCGGWIGFLKQPKFKNQGFGKHGSVNGFTFWKIVLASKRGMALLLNHILIIIRGCALKQMGGIYTSTIVAFVADHNIRRQKLPKMEKPRSPMSINADSVFSANADMSIPLANTRGCPVPAFGIGTFFHLVPETIFKTIGETLRKCGVLFKYVRHNSSSIWIVLSSRTGMTAGAGTIYLPTLPRKNNDLIPLLMRRLAAILMSSSLVITAGCSTVQHAGQSTGRFGTGILVTSAAVPVFIPIGIVIALPLWGIGVPTYYLAGGREKHPFDL